MAKEMNYEALQANLKMLDKKGELAFEQARAAGTLTNQQEKFSALISDEAFLEKFFAADSVEEVKALFSENGLDLSEEDINAFGKYIADVSKKLIENGGEISEEELEQVAGGMMGLSSGEEKAVGVGTSVGILGGAGAGMYGGAIVGSAILPGFGSVIGGIIGAGIGLAAGIVGGGAAGFFGTAGAIKGAKKLGKWIKSWF